MKHADILFEVEKRYKKCEFKSFKNGVHQNVLYATAKIFCVKCS